MSDRHDPRHQPLVRCVWTIGDGSGDRASLVASWSMASPPDLLNRDTTVAPSASTPIHRADPAMTVDAAFAGTSVSKLNAW